MRFLKPLMLLGAFVAVAVGAFWAGAGWNEPGSRDLSAKTFFARTTAPTEDPYAGRFYRMRASGADEVDPAEAAEELEALGYLGGTVEAATFSGVTVHDSARVYASLNLYTSGHAPEAYLMGMDGTLLHTWRYSFEDLWPNYDGPPANTEFWRRAHVFENGDLLAIIEPVGIFKVDKDSNLIWKNQCGAHHDISVLDDGRILTLTYSIKPVPWFSDVARVYDDRIALMSPDGEILKEVSLLECLRNSPYSAELEGAEKTGDVLHANAVKYLDGRHEGIAPFFREGNVLVSIRELDLVVVVDLDAESVVWAVSGMWHRQHESTLLDSGNLLVFDNRGNSGRSKVVEFAPLTKEVVWTYGVEESEPLESITCGTALRLPNGNTMITESNNGRALEVAPDKSVVWEYYSPHRAGDLVEFVATLFDMRRLPANFEAKWLKGDGSGRASS